MQACMHGFRKKKAEEVAPLSNAIKRLSGEGRKEGKTPRISSSLSHAIISCSPFPMLFPVPVNKCRNAPTSTQLPKPRSVLIPSFPGPLHSHVTSRPGSKDINDPSPGHSSSVSVPCSWRFVPSSLLVSLVQPCPLAWVVLRLCSWSSLGWLNHVWHPRDRSTVDDPCTRQRSRPPTWLPSVNGGFAEARWRGMRRCRSRGRCLVDVNKLALLSLGRERGCLGGNLHDNEQDSA